MAKVVIYAGTSTDAAKIVGNESTALDEAAAPILARAEALAAAHVKTGAYQSSFGVKEIKGKKGVTDRAVYNDDPAASWIEWGHVANTKKGPVWVDGLGILTKAMHG